MKNPNAITILKQVLILVCLPIVNTLFSQNYDISTIAVNNNNYSASTKKKLHLDSDGFLWYSTHNGVVKEMGNGNSHYFEYAGPIQKDIYTYDILKNSKNELWATTGEGINIIDFNSGESRWISEKYPFTDITVNFTSLKEDNKGNIWLATDKDYLYHYNNENKLSWTKILNSDFKAKNNVYFGAPTKIETILEDGSLILHQENKWFLIKGESNVLLFDDYSLFNPTNKTSTVLIDSSSFFNKKSSGNYVYNNIIYQYKYIKKINKLIVQVPFESAQFLSKNNNQNFFKKIDLFATDNTKLIALKFYKDENDGLKLQNEATFTFNNKITNATYDKSGCFLLHTEAGISKIKYKSAGFKQYLSGKNISCRGFSEDIEGNLFVFTYEGIFKLENGQEDFKEIETIKDQKTYDYVTTVSYNFYKENDTTFWFYGFHESLIKFNVVAGTFETYKFPKSKVVITDAERIVGSKLLLATNLGLYSFDLENKTFQNESALNEAIDLNDIVVVDLMLNKRKSTLWIATKDIDHALVKIDYATNIISSFSPEKKGMPIINNEITSIFEDEKNNLWLGTLNGIQKINPVNYISKSFTLAEGLKNDNVSGILEDDNYLWVSTFNGLIKLNKKTESLQTFYKEDGIPNNEFNRKSHIKTSDGRLYFGGLDGIVGFDPKVISKNDRNHRLFLSEYKKYDSSNETITSYFNYNESITKFNIPYQQNYLTLKFAINDIIDPNKNVYQYRITELSKDWVNLGNHNTLQILGLKSGSYHAEVRGFSSNGNQTNVLKYTININQVFYKRPWFISLVILGLLAFLMLKNKIREVQITKKHKKELKLNQLRYNAMVAQKSPRFTYDILSNLQEVMIKKGEHEATKYFNIFSSFLGTKISMKNSEYILIKDEIEYLKSYVKLENLKLENRIEIKFEVDNTVKENSDKIPCMLFQAIVEDALVNGIIPKKYDLKLGLHFKIENNNLIGEVIDNGIPRVFEKKRKKKNQAQSKITAFMEERLRIANSLLTKKIKYSIVDIKSEGDHLGTKATLTIPLNNLIHFDKKKALEIEDNDEEPIEEAT